MSENFANAPVSIGELRSERSDNASDWTPRDAMIDMLRRIDKDEINPSELIVVYKNDGKVTWKASYEEASSILGCMEMAKFTFMR